MPFLLPAAATAVAAAAPAAAATTAAATAGATLTSIATNIAMNVAISAVMSALQPQVGAAGRTAEWTLSPDGPIPFAAGRIGVAGSVVHRATFGPDLMYLGVPAVLSGAGPIDGYESFKADDEWVNFDGNGKAISSQYAGELWYRRTMGYQPDVAVTSPPGLKSNATLPGWGAQHKLSGKAAYMVVMGENSKGTAFPTGEIKPLITLRGLKGWDPRLDSTWPGGDGPCRLDNPATWVYLRRPGLWGLKWSLGLWEGPSLKGAPAHGSATDHQVGGIGAKLSGIDVAAFVNLENICDANDWTVSAYPTTDDDKFAVLESFLQAGGATFAMRAGKISCIQRAAPRTSIVTISAADTAGPLEIDTAASRIDRINTIRPRIMSEAHRWQMTAIAEVSAQAYRDQDGGVRPRGIDYTYVDKATQGAQLAALQIANTREGIAGVIPLKPHLQKIKPGDAFTITEPGFVLNGLKCLCLSTEFDPSTKIVAVSFVSETDAKYPFALGQSQEPPEPAELEPVDPRYVSPPGETEWEIVARPPAEGGAQVPGFDLVGEVDNATATALLVEWGPTAEGPWTQAYMGPPTAERIPITGVQPKAVYYVSTMNIRGQNYSARRVYGPFTAPDLVSNDTVNVGDRPAGDVAAEASQVPGLALTLAGAQLVLADHQTQLYTATTGLLDRTAAMFATLNTPSTGVLARLTAAESNISGNNVATVLRLNALEASVNTPSTGLLALTAAQQTAISNLQTGKADALSLTLVEARALTLERLGALSNPNSEFTDWTGSLPALWSQAYSVGGITQAKVAGDNGAGNAIDVTVPANGVHEISQNTGTARSLGRGWYVMEVDVELVSGSWQYGGARLYSYDAANNNLAANVLYFDTDPDVTGTVRGPTPAPGRYSYRHLVEFPHAATDHWYFGVSAGGLWGSNKAATGRVVIRRAGFRPATATEVEMRQARGGFSSLAARSAASDSAIVNLQTGKAEAARVTLVEARAAAAETTGLFPNDTFSDWPNADNTSPNWWSKSEVNSAGIQRVAGFQARPYAARMYNLDGVSTTSLATPYTAGRAGHYVVEAEFTLVSGSLEGAGLVCRGDSVGGYSNEGYMYLSGATGRDNFASDGAFNTSPDSEGVIPGAGVPGRTYRMSKLIRLRDVIGEIVNVRLLVFGNGINNYSGNGGSAAKDIKLHRARMRVATPAEIEQRSARGGFVSLAARYAATETAVVDLQAGKASVARVELLEARAAGANLLKSSQVFTTNLNDVWTLNANTFGGIALIDTDARYKPVGENYLYAQRSLATGYMQLIAGTDSDFSGVTVKEGLRYCLSMFVKGGRSQIIGVWRGADGGYLGETAGGVASAVNLPETGFGGDTLAAWKRIWIFGTAPAGAAKLQLYWQLEGSSTGVSFGALRPMISEATSTQTEAPPWAPPSLESKVIELRLAAATLEGRLESRAVLQTVAGNQVSGMQLLAVSGPDVGYSTIDFWASAVRISNGGTNPTAPFVVRDNQVRIQELLVDRVAVGASIVVGSRRLALAVQPFPVSITDGVPVTYGYNIGQEPNIVFLRDGAIQTPGSAESYDFTAEASTGNGFTPRLKIKTASAPANVTHGPGGHASTSAAEFYYALNSGRANTTVNVRSTGVIQYQWVNNRFGSGPDPIYEEAPGYEWDRYTEGYLVLQTKIYNGSAWRDGPPIEVYPPPLNSGTTGLRTSAYDTGDVPITVNPGDTHVGISLSYESHSGSYISDLRLGYQTAGASGVRSATPNGELTTAMIYPRNAA